MKNSNNIQLSIEKRNWNILVIALFALVVNLICINANAQNREGTVVADDGTVISTCNSAKGDIGSREISASADPVMTYAKNNQGSALADYFLSNPGDADCSSLIKLKLFTENPGTYLKGYSESEIADFKAQITKMQIQLVEKLKASSEQLKSKDQNISRQDAALMENNQRLIKELSSGIPGNENLRETEPGHSSETPSLFKAD